MPIYAILIAYGAALLLSFFLCIPKIAQLGGMRRKPEHKIATDKRRIALVIPARSESRTIGDLFDSILRQDYDSSKFDVNVIVNDADDPTIDMAKRMHANVFVVPNQKCKGDALDGYFKSLSPEKMNSYDAFVIVDADAVLTDNYVTELNNALEYDKDVFCTNKHVKNYLGSKRNRSIICTCAALAYTMNDELGNFYRAEKNVPANSCGQGLMIRRAVIEKLGGWPYRTLTEDYELKMDSFVKGFTSMYYPYAVLYTEEVIKHRECCNRRMRWATGYSQCNKLYRKAVKEKIKKDGASFALKYDFLYIRVALLLCPLATIVVMLCGIGFTVYYAVIGSTLWLHALLLLVALPAVMLYLILYVYGLIAITGYRDALKTLPVVEKMIVLAFNPFFLLEWIGIYLRSRSYVKKPQADWTPTERIEF